MNTNIEIEVSELTKTYAILNGEKIVFDGWLSARLYGQQEQEGIGREVGNWSE